MRPERGIGALKGTAMRRAARHWSAELLGFQGRKAMPSRFENAVADVRQAIRLLGRAAVPDAVELLQRRSGKNNLQAHAEHLTRLAALFLLEHPKLAAELAEKTDLEASLSGRERIWGGLAGPFRTFVNKRGSAVVSREIASGVQLSVASLANTYLPVTWGGSHETGGGGASSLKRALKIGAHAFAAAEPPK